MTQLAGVIITLNEESNILDCIDSLRWADEVVVFDSYSTDRTVARARSAGAKIYLHRFENYGAQREAALAAVEAEWVFFVDADERATPELGVEIREKLIRPERGWWVPRHNYIFGKLTLGAGWFPDHQLRLLHRASAHYDPGRPVHEEVMLDGEAGFLTSPLIHYNYRDVRHFIAKQEGYTDYEAQIRFGRGEKPKPWTYLSGPLRHFWWRFVTLHGYRDGAHGLRLCLLTAYYEFQTWRRVSQLSRQSKSED